MVDAGEWQAAADGLKRRIWITKGARFNAHKRLQNRHQLSIASISFLSIYVIILSLIDFVFPVNFNAAQKAVLSFSEVALALFILVLSLLETSKSYDAQSRAFHGCGRELSGIYERLNVLVPFWKHKIESDINKELSELSQEYTHVLDRCSENHDLIDTELFKIEHNEEFKLGWVHRTNIEFKLFWDKYFPCAILIIIPPPVIFGLILLLK